MFQKILVPVDDSPLAAATLDAALHYAHAFGGTVTLLHVQEKAASLDRDEVKTDLAVIERETALLLARAGERAAAAGVNPPVDATVRSGPLEATILETAEELRSHLIVMGTHGRQTMTDTLLGSSAERIVAKATCAVLVVKPAGFPFLRE